MFSPSRLRLVRQVLNSCLWTASSIHQLFVHISRPGLARPFHHLTADHTGPGPARCRHLRSDDAHKLRLRSLFGITADPCDCWAEYREGWTFNLYVCYSWWKIFTSKLVFHHAFFYSNELNFETRSLTSRWHEWSEFIYVILENYRNYLRIY